MNLNASSSLSVRSLECGDIMGDFAKWLTEITFCCLMNIVFRNSFILHDIAFGSVQHRRTLKISFVERGSASIPVFLSKVQDSSLDLMWFTAYDFRSEFFWCIWKQKNQRTSSRIIIEALIFCSFIYLWSLKTCLLSMNCFGARERIPCWFLRPHLLFWQVTT